MSDSSSSSCQASTDEESSTIYGILLVLGACVCYAIGNCLQRYSLLKKDGEKVFYILHKQVGWLLGAIIYFSANGLYAVALTFAPVSVLAAVFSLTIVANAACANFLLGDQVALAAIPGYVMVLAGSVVFSVSVQAEVCDYDADGLISVLTSGIAILYWLVAGLFLIFGLSFAYTFESKFPYQEPTDSAEEDDAKSIKNEPQETSIVKEGSNSEDPEQPPPVFENEATNYVRHTPSVTSCQKEIPLQWNFGALVLYPATLGTLEAAGALLLNGINTLFTSLGDKDEDEGEEDTSSHIGLWVGLYGVGICIFLGIVLFLRLVYRRFEITAAFPTEFGVLTFGSVVGGFLVFQDFRFLEGVGDVLLVLLASALILGGIAVVGYASWRKQQQLASDDDASPDVSKDQSDIDSPAQISQASSA